MGSLSPLRRPSITPEGARGAERCFGMRIAGKAGSLYNRLIVSVHVSQRLNSGALPTGGSWRKGTSMLDRFLSSWTSARRPALLGLMLFFCAGFADGAVVPFFPFWAGGEGGIPVGAIGLLFGCYAGGELVATPLVGGIADRIGRRFVLIAASVGVGAGFVALFFTHGVIAAGAVLLLTGMFESVLHPTIGAVIGDVVEPDARRRVPGGRRRSPVRWGSGDGLARRDHAGRRRGRV